MREFGFLSGRCAQVAAAASGLAVALAALPAKAGQPTPWGLGFQGAASPSMESVRWFHDSILMPVITVITLFVLGLILYVV